MSLHLWSEKENVDQLDWALQVAAWPQASPRRSQRMPPTLRPQRNAGQRTAVEASAIAHPAARAHDDNSDDQRFPLGP